MPKFSIIIPVYNVEDYISDCFNSIQAQTFQDYEVIIVNDGTKDHSQEKIDSYVLKDARFHSYQKENGGQSSARNFGIEKAVGTYMIFVDGDDKIEPRLLEEIDGAIKRYGDIDLIRYQVKKVFLATGSVKKLQGKAFDLMTGEEAFQSFLSDELFDSPCLYAFRTSFWKQYHFQYKVGRIHEDFGLIPYVILKAKSVVSLSYYGYDYMERTDSVMTKVEEAHMIRRMNDMFYHYDVLFQLSLEDADISKEGVIYFQSFLANAILNIGGIIPNSKKAYYRKQVKERRIWFYLIHDTFIRKVKRCLVRHAFWIFLCLYLRKR